jgi:CheY-like chemotaxis protein
MPYRILIADDELIIRRLLTVILEPGGYVVATAGDGAEALAKAQADPPDLMILDLMMPETTGLEVLAALRQDPRFKKLPVVVATAAGSQTYIDRALELGATRCIMKPFMKAEVLQLLKELLP